MDDNLQQLLKGLLGTLALTGMGFYLKIAKNKEPYASNNLWKILITIGAVGFILSIVRYIINK